MAPDSVPPVAEVGSGGRRVDPSRRPLCFDTDGSGRAPSHRLSAGVFFCPFKKLCQCFRYGYGPPDGYRLQIHVRDGRVKLYTINGADWSKRYPRIVESRAWLQIVCREVE